MHEFANRSVQVSGTFGTGGSVSIMGSYDNATFAELTDVFGTELTFTEAGSAVIHNLPPYVRPEVTAGDAGTDLTVTLIA